MPGTRTDRATPSPAGSPTSPPAAAPGGGHGAPAAQAPTAGLTVYGCGQDEAAAFGEAAPRFGIAVTMTDRALSEGTVGLATGSRCVSVDHRTRVDGATLRALSRVGVRYVSTRSVGCDHIDVAAARRVGVTVGTVGYSPDSVADFTVMLMLMALRHATTVLGGMAARDYRLHRRGRELRDMTVGVVGVGRIGAAVIARLRGFGCDVVAHDRRPTAVAPHLSLGDLLRRSDVVTLHTPLTAGTHHLLDRRRIAQMRPGALVVNTGRGPLIDTGALIDALQAGRLGGAALDVVEGEEGLFSTDCRDRPIDGTWLDRLHRVPNVLVTPHTAYFTDHALRDVVEGSLTNCLRFETEGTPWAG